MGKLLNIETDSGKQINEDLGGNRFIDLVVCGDTDESEIPYDKIFTQNQLDILDPDWDLDEDAIITLRNPQDLLDCFKLLKDYIKKNHSKLPLSHWIEDSPNSWTGRSKNFIYKGNECHLNGLHNLVEYRNYIKLIWNEKDNHVNAESTEWIRTNSTISLDNETINIKTMNWLEEFGSYLDVLIDFCNMALAQKEKIIWTIDT